MLFLWNAPDRDITLLAPLQTEADHTKLIFNACTLLIKRGKIEVSAYLTTFGFQLRSAENQFGDPYLVLHAGVDIDRYEFLRGNMVEEVHGKGKFATITSRLAEPYHSHFTDAVNALGDFGFHVDCVVCTLEQVQPPQNWLQAISSGTTPSAGNQGVFSFPNSQIYVHQGLKFRSKTEIKIFDELVSRKVLVFPLAAAVMGKPGDILEPDLLVIYNGKSGILDIHGEPWHPPQRAAKEHERRREFLKLGIQVYEFFDAGECWNNPKVVVDKFLGLF